jgi:hypothetical protein
MYKYYSQLKYKDKVKIQVVEGYKLKNDLAVNKDENNNWVLTDIPTGCLVKNNIKTFKEAKDLSENKVFLKKLENAREQKFALDMQASLSAYFGKLDENSKLNHLKKYFE